MINNERKARELAAVLRVDLSVTVTPGKFFDVDMWAPKGFGFVDSGCHTSVLNWDGRYEDEPYRPAKLWGEVVARLEMGLEPCEADCECRGNDGE